MPSAEIHRKLTSWAMGIAPELFNGEDAAALQTRYCLYPDLVTSGDSEAEKFSMEHAGVQFHYLPDAPLENVYRYYRREPNGVLRRSRSFVNPHYEFALAGIRHYLELILRFLREAHVEEAMKATGTLLHVLQDNTFGIHTLEGAGGTDVFFFDRLKLWKVSPFQTLARLDCGNETPTGLRAPMLLGNSVDEAALRIYRHWCDAMRIGRSICIKLLFNPDTDIVPMISTAVLLSADVLHTLHELAHHQSVDTRELTLEDLEPYESPSRGLAILPDGTCTFPITAEEHLLYRFPAGVFALLSVKIATADQQTVRYDLINDGKIESRGEFNAGAFQDLRIIFPTNECGIKFYAESGATEIILKQSALQRQATPAHSPSRQ